MKNTLEGSQSVGHQSLRRLTDAGSPVRDHGSLAFGGGDNTAEK